MTNEELEIIRAWDRRCGDNEGTFFPVTLDRRRLLEYVDELLARIASLTQQGRSRPDQSHHPAEAGPRETTRSDH